MNDRFKFRIFYSNKMVYPNRYDHIESIYECLKQQIMWDSAIATDFKFNHIANELVFMQCTGLKDKNGKLIYEGDIINIWCKNYTKNQISEVKFCKERAAFTFDYFTDYGNIVPCTMEKTEIEVIGNIYENKELLEEECQK